MSNSILIVDDDETFAGVLAKALSRRGYIVQIAHNRSETQRAILENHFDRVILDLNVGDDSGLTLLPEIVNHRKNTSIVILTGYSSIATAVEAIKLGAVNYLCKPADADEILAAFVDQPGNPQISLSKEPPSIERIQWEHIQKILTEHNGNISATARSLGMHRRTLQRKLKKHPAQR